MVAKHHASDLAREFGLLLRHHPVKLLAQHLLLHARRRGGQRRGAERGVSCVGGRHLLGRPRLALHLHALWARAARHAAWHAAHAAGHAAHHPARHTLPGHAAHHASLHALPGHPAHHRAGHALPGHHAHHRHTLPLHHAGHRHARAHAHHLHLLHLHLLRHHPLHHALARHPREVHLGSTHHSLLLAVHLHAAALVALAHAAALAVLAAAPTHLVPVPQALQTGLPLLSETDVQRLALDDLEVHLCHRLGGLVRGTEADEAEALALALLVLHRSDRGDGAERLEELPQGGVVRVLLKVFHVQVHAVGLVPAGAAVAVELRPERRHALGLGLRPGAIEEVVRVSFAVLRHLLLALLSVGLLLLLAPEILLVHRFDALLRRVALLVVHEREPTAFSVGHEGARRDGTELSELRLELVLVPVRGHVLDVEVGEVGGVGALAVLAFHEGVDFHGLVADLHAVHALDGLLRGLLRLVVHEAVSARFAARVGRHLAGEDVAEEAEGVVQRLVVDVPVQVLHEDVAHAALPQARVAMAPHDPAGAALDVRVVQRVQRALGVGHGVEVHVAVSQRPARDAVPAHADGGHGPHRVEDLVEHGLGHVGVEVAHVERRELRDAGGRHDC